MPKRKSSRKSLKRSSLQGQLATIKKVVKRIVNPPLTGMRQFSGSIAAGSNAKLYYDLAPYIAGSDNSFGNSTSLNSLISQAISSTYNYVHDQIFIHLLQREWEFTNITNSIVYVTLYKLEPRFHNRSSTDPLYGIGNAYNNVTFYPNAATTPIVGTVGSGAYVASSVLPYVDAMMDPLMRRLNYHTEFDRIGKEFEIAPQQTVKFKQKRRNFLYSASRYVIGNESTITNGLATNYKGITERLIISLTGMTARATSDGSVPVLGAYSYVNSAPVGLQVNWVDKIVASPPVTAFPNTPTVKVIASANGPGYLNNNYVFEMGMTNNEAELIQ